MRPRLLDLFCGAGGAAMGYHRAGFDVVGVDIRPQPNYPFDFLQADALEVLRDNAVIWEDVNSYSGYRVDEFDAIHASPPCQAFTRARVIQGRDHADLLTPARDLLELTGLPWVIENVVGAPMRNPVTVCAAALLVYGGFELRRHRLFEANFPLMAEPCSCGSLPPCFAYGHSQDNNHKVSYGPCGAETRRQVMGVPWMNRNELAEAIPPAFTELIGHQLLQHINVKAEAV